MQTSPGLQIYRMGSFSFLPIQILFVLEGCWSVDIPSNKIRFTAEVLINAFETHWGKLFFHLFIFFFILKEQYNLQTKAQGTWVGRQEEETQSV